MASGRLKELVPGTEINFAGSWWIILNPLTGYLFKKESIGGMVFDDNNTNIFDPSDTNNVGYYLNTTFFNTFSNEDKGAIKTFEWGIGSLSHSEAGHGDVVPSLSLAQMKVKENTSTISAKIGLLSVSEWRENSKYTRHAGSSGILDAPPITIWLRTPYSGDAKQVWNVRGGIGDLNYNDATHGLGSVRVHPAIYLDPNTSIINDIVVHYVPPNLSPNINGEYREYDGGWVKVNGVWREIDEIQTKINGVWRKSE